MLQMQLLNTVVQDIFKYPLRNLLYVLVMLSAFAVILVTHENRDVSRQLEALLQQQDELDVEWRHLILEQSALTEHNRIEALVENKLNMRRPTPSEEVVVRIE
jgi:cell division protein FtsL